MRSMENAEYGKCGVWKMRSIACGNALSDTDKVGE